MCKRVFALLAILIFWTAGVYAVEEVLPLDYWIDEALVSNPEYQLFLADHELALQELELAERLGIKDVRLSLPPLTLGTKGANQNYGLGLQYTGLLPKKIQLSGGNSLSTDAQGRIKLSGNLQVGFNPRILWEKEAEYTVMSPYIDQNQRRQEARLNLVSSVVNRYIELIRVNLQAEVAGGKQKLALANLEKAQREYDSGLISLLDLYTVEDAHHAAVQYVASVQRDRKQAVANFYKTVGQIPNGTEEVPLVELANLQLSLPEVEEFLTQWDSMGVKGIPEDIYTLVKARFALEQAEKTVEQARASSQWQFQLSAGVNYATGGQFDVSGTLGLSKELYNPGGKLNLRQAEIQLERQRLAYQEAGTKLYAQVESQVEQVRNARADIAGAQDDLQLANERYLRVVKQVQQGFLPERDVLQIEVNIQEKQLALLQAIETEIKARLALAQTLGLAGFAEIE